MREKKREREDEIENERYRDTRCVREGQRMRGIYYENERERERERDWEKV